MSWCTQVTVRLAEAFFHLVLALYPRRVRQRDGDEMLLLFRELSRDARRSGRGGRFAVAAVIDALAGLRQAHRRPARAVSVDRHRHFARPSRKATVMSTFSHDLRVSWRRLARRPGTTALAATSLALGIGAATAIFSVVYGVLLRPLGLEEPENLAVASLHREGMPSDAMGFSPMHLEALRSQVGSGGLEGLATYLFDSMTLQGESGAEELGTAVAVDGEFFPLVGARPLLGRALGPDDVVAGRRGDVCVLGESLWRTRFGADPGIVGRSLRLDGETVTVVGVMASHQLLPIAGVDLWIAQHWDVRDRSLRGRLGMLARLEAPASFEKAGSVLASVVASIAVVQPRLAGYTVSLSGFRESVVGPARGMIFAAAGGVLLLLLIACANLASLQVARAVTREQEMATRRALGAKRHQVASQVLCESLLLSLIGGAAGVLLAFALHRLLIGMAANLLPRAGDVRLDLPVLGFALAATLASGLLFGLAPVAFTFTRDLAGAMRGALGVERPVWTRLRSGLVIAQVALAVALSLGAVLMARSLVALGAVDPGFDSDGVGIARVYLDGDAYRSDKEKALYWQHLRSLLVERPDIAEAGASSGLPMDPITIDFDVPYTLPGEPPEGDMQRQAYFRTITPGYLEAMGIALRRGRTIDATDRADTEPVAVVSETLAQRAWPGEDAVGRRFSFFGGSRTVRVVGVVSDVHFAGPADQERAEFFVPHTQITYGSMTVAARSSAGDAEAAAGAIAAVALELDPTQPAHSFFPMRALESQAVASPRFLTLLLITFAAAALLLAAAGIFGALAGWVADRRREIGLRVALGAAAGDILGLVFRRSAWLAAAGLLLGAGVARLGAGLLAPHLFGVGAEDAVSLAVVAVLVVLITTLASLLPARRAARLEPTRVLRSE